MNNFGKRNYRFKGGNQVSESKSMTIAIIIGIAIIALLIYLD
jgi:hypothetical protein